MKINSSNNVSLSEKEQQVLIELYDIPLVPQPVTTIGQKLGMSLNQVLETISHLKKKGVIRKLAPVYSHRGLGYDYNAMVLLGLNEKNIGHIAAKLSKRKEISHVFRRDNRFGMNLYVMVHARSEEELVKIISQIVNKTQVPILVAATDREIKKESLPLLEEW